MKWHIDPTKLVIHNKLVYICKYFNGTIQEKIYLLNGKLHNPNGPAYQNWYNNGKLSHECYYLNGMRHRTDGPAYIALLNNGLEFATYYYMYGRCYTLQEFNATLNK